MSTVLYAEDDRDCRELFAFALRNQGYAVHEALNGAQAVQIVRDETIDLVILDARMPMMTGYEAAHLIAAEKPDIPIMFLSARGLRREINLAFECGPAVVDYLIKPISPDELVARVETILTDCQTRGIETVRAENMVRELVVEW